MNWSIQLLVHPAGLKKYGQEWCRFGTFHFFKTITFSQQFRSRLAGGQFLMQFWIISGVSFVPLLGALLDPGFQSNPKENKGFLLFPVFKMGYILRHLLGSFLVPHGVSLSRPGHVLRPLVSTFPLFQDNYFFNSIPAPASGLEKVPAGSARILVFSLFQAQLLQYNNSRPGRRVGK